MIHKFRDLNNGDHFWYKDHLHVKVDFHHSYKITNRPFSGGPVCYSDRHGPYWWYDCLGELVSSATVNKAENLIYSGPEIPGQLETDTVVYVYEVYEDGSFIIARKGDFCIVAGRSWSNLDDFKKIP